MKPFTESMRYEYPLGPASLVIDCGGYEGNFARTLIEKYGCAVLVFEPVPEFYARIVALKLPFAQVYNSCVGATERTESITVKGDSSGIFAGGGNAETGVVVPIGRVLDDVSPLRVDLLKLNVEGMEFEILEWLLEHDRAREIRNIQVQFHTCAPDAENRWKKIRAGLLQTHELTFDAPWCWENYRLKA